MKPVTFKVIRTNELVVCDDAKAKRLIDSDVYLVVHRPGDSRQFLMKMDALTKVTTSKVVDKR